MRTLIISGHDFRSARKANIHFIASELSAFGPVRMFSVGLSPLTLVRGRDPRIGMGITPNRPEFVGTTECYMWMSPVHPFSTPTKLTDAIMAYVFDWYKRSVPNVMKLWASQADLILIESGLPVLWIDYVRELNSTAKLIYNASDDLDTIGCSRYLVQLLNSNGGLLDAMRVPSVLMKDLVPSCSNVLVIPHGIDGSLDSISEVSPYGPGVHGVSVGSMLFDPTFFYHALASLPDIQFHVIGCGLSKNKLPPSVHYYPEMAQAKTLPFIKYAQFGVAPYSGVSGSYYLADTSMKLMQYDYLGLPSACPDFAVGEGHPLRFGFSPGNAASIKLAIEQARTAEHVQSGTPISWRDVTSSILEGVGLK